MLTQNERDVVVPLLLGVVSVAPSPRQALAAYMDLTLSSQLEEGSAAFLVERALNLSQNDAFRQTPPAIIQLLTGLLPDLPEITAIADRLSAPPPGRRGSLRRACAAQQPAVPRPESNEAGVEELPA